MDFDSDISNSKAKISPQPLPNIKKAIHDAFSERELGFRSKKTCVASPALKASAEDELVKKEYKEMKCSIPDLAKSTFLMVFSPDGTKMASTHGNHNIYVTDLRTGKHIKTLVGHPRTPWCIAFHPSSNQILASGCLGGQVRIWDLSGGSEVWTAESQNVISSLAFHPVDRLLVIATFNKLYFWDWSQPKPFMQTHTNNVKEKVRYVAFDRLGQKLITGIANTPQGFTRWERVRAPPAPITRPDRSPNPYRRRGPRFVPINPQHSSPFSENIISINNPDRNRPYRNVVDQFEVYLRHADRPTTTIDRGTDPMEAEHLNVEVNNTRSMSSINSFAETSGTYTMTTTVANSSRKMQPSSSSSRSIAPFSSRVSSAPGPSGLSKVPQIRPKKRTNIPDVKSDSSTMYQSDSSSSGSSDDSPTPKRRINLIANSNLFKSKDESKTSSVKSSNDSSTQAKASAENSSQVNSNQRRAISVEGTANNGNEPSSDTSNSSSNSDNNLQFSLGGRLQGISEETLGTLDEVINFSERPIHTEEPDAEPPENLNEIPLMNTRNTSEGIENVYAQLLTDLEMNLTEIRNSARIEANRNSNLAATFSEQLENIMNQSDAILASLRRNMSMFTDPTNQPNISSNVSSNRTSTNAQSSSAFGINPVGQRNLFLRKAFNLRHRPIMTRNFNGRSGNYNGLHSNSMSTPVSSNTRGSRYVRVRHPRFNARSQSTPNNLRHLNDRFWTPTSNSGRENVMRTIFPARRNASENNRETNRPERNSPTLIPSLEHNYPLPQPTSSNNNSANGNPIADHNYLSDSQNSTNYLNNTMSPLHSTISQITARTNLLRREFENLEAFDRARFEVVQLHELRRMWEEIRQHVEAIRESTNERRSNLSNVRQMMAWTRISDPSPSSESGPSSTDQSTEPTPSTSTVTSSTSRNSASSNSERHHSIFNRFHLKKMYWKRRTMKNDRSHFFHRRHLRNNFRDARMNRFDMPNRLNSSSSDSIVSSMIASLESLLREKSYHLTNRRAPHSSRSETRQLSYHMYILTNFFEYLETRPIITPLLNEQIIVLKRLALILINLLLLQVMSSISAELGLMLDPERESLSIQISEMCTNMLQNHNLLWSGSLFRDINGLRESIRGLSEMSRNLRSNSSGSQPEVQSASNRRTPKQGTASNRSSNNNNSSDYQRPSVSSQSTSSEAISALPRLSSQTPPVNASTSTENILTHVSRLDEILVRIRYVRNRLESLESRASTSERFTDTTTTRMLLNSIREADRIRRSFIRRTEQSQISQVRSSSTSRPTLRPTPRSTIRPVTRLTPSPPLPLRITFLDDILTDMTRFRSLIGQRDDNMPTTSQDSQTSNQNNINNAQSSRFSFVPQPAPLPRPHDDLVRGFQRIQRYREQMPITSQYSQTSSNNMQSPRFSFLPSVSSPALTSFSEIDEVETHVRGLVAMSQHSQTSNQNNAQNTRISNVPLPPSTPFNNEYEYRNYRLDQLLARARNIRSQIEQVLHSARVNNLPNDSSSTTDQEPSRSTDDSPPSELETERIYNHYFANPFGTLYRTHHINLYHPDLPSSSQSSPEQSAQHLPNNRTMTIPNINIQEIATEPRMWFHRASELRQISAATGVFTPRFVIPLVAGLPAFDDIDDSVRNASYDHIINSTVSPSHRIQMWDISKCNIPNISNHEKNIVVAECKIHNDGSVDISSDGTLLVTLLPSGSYLNVTNRLGIYSIKWDTLGQCLYTTSFEQNAISVSLSPLSRHLIVGLASKRIALLPSDRWTMARIFLLDDKNIKTVGRGKLVLLRDLEQGRDRDLNFVSVNCIKWMPVSGQGIAYATNTGQLKVLT